jgi:hypothetical protein
MTMMGFALENVWAPAGAARNSAPPTAAETARNIPSPRCNARGDRDGKRVRIFMLRMRLVSSAAIAVAALDLDRHCGAGNGRVPAVIARLGRCRPPDRLAWSVAGRRETSVVIQ